MNGGLLITSIDAAAQKLSAVAVEIRGSKLVITHL